MFTDRVCDQDEAEKIPQQPLSNAIIGNSVNTRPGIALPPSCNRNPEELLYGVRSAIDMNDVNQLAKQYHWLGVTDAQAEQLMNRLEILANSPLIDIQLQYPVEAENELLSSNTNTDALTDESLDPDAESFVASSQKRTAPYALRVTHYISNTNSQTQSSTFRLQRHFDCWWIRY